MQGIGKNYIWVISDDDKIHLRYARGSKRVVCSRMISRSVDIDPENRPEEVCVICAKFAKEEAEKMTEDKGEVKEDAVEEEELKDSWTTEDSSFDDDWDLWVKDASFGFRSEYKDGEIPLLILEGLSPEGELREYLWTLGKGWEIEDNGKSVSHIKGKERFHKSSNIGMLVNQLVKVLGIGSELRTRGNATEAKVWVGLGMHMQRTSVTRDGLKDDDGNTKTSDVLLPVTFLGFDGDDKNSGATGKPTVSQAEKKLEVFCNLPQDRFIEKACELSEVLEDGKLLDHVMDKSDTGYWSTHQKK